MVLKKELLRLGNGHCRETSSLSVTGDGNDKAQDTVQDEKVAWYATSLAGVQEALPVRMSRNNLRQKDSPEYDCPLSRVVEHHESLVA